MKNIKSIENQLDLWNNKEKNTKPVKKRKTTKKVPISIIKQSLFSATIEKGHRKQVHNAIVGKSGIYTLIYNGTQLDQPDQDFLLELIKLYEIYNNTQSVENIVNNKSKKTDYIRIILPLRIVSKRTKGTTAKGTIKWIKDVLERLTGRITIKRENHNFASGPIIGKYSYNLDTDLITIDINNDFLPLFTNNKYIDINTKIRLSLNKNFSKWLYVFISSNPNIHESTADHLYKLSSSKYKRLRDWKRKEATPAFEELIKQGLIKRFTPPKTGQKNYTWSLK